MNPNHEMKISKECIELHDVSRREMYVTFSIIEVGYTELVAESKIASHLLIY